MKMFYNEKIGLWECKCPLCGVRCVGNDWVLDNGSRSDRAFFFCENCLVARSQGKLDTWGRYPFEVKKETQKELFGQMELFG